MTALEDVKCRALVVGAGPAGLAAAEALALAGVTPIVIDGGRAPARKFLLAGRGGLNLTHSEKLEAFLARYGPEAARLRDAIAALPPTDLRAWSESLGEPTFVGSSGRVFPRSFKAAPLLRAWLRRLDASGVTLRLRHRLTGFEAQGRALVATPAGMQAFAADAIVLALGGASWPHLGSDGAWAEILRGQGVGVAPLQPANSGFVVAWSTQMEAFAGKPLKNLALRFGRSQARGEAMITAAGLEGGGIYGLSRPLREAIVADGAAMLEIDLKPDITLPALAVKLARPAKESVSTWLRKGAGLEPQAIALAREPGPLPREPLALAERVKRVVLRLTATAPIARAISTAGGVKWSELDERYMLIKRPGVFAAGEMIDWEAPTGGYLLQACFATGAAAGRGAAAWLSSERRGSAIGRFVVSVLKIRDKANVPSFAAEAHLFERMVAVRGLLGGAFLVAAAALPSLAHADDPPTRKPGLWEITTSMKAAPKSEVCVDAASEEKFNAMGAATMKDTCSRFQGHRDGAIYTQDSVCKLMGSTLTSHTVMTSVSDAEYKIELSAHYDPPFMGKTDSTTTVNGKWIGPCGPDMQPGDMLVNGRKLHPGAGM